MTVATTTNKAIATGNGVATTFPFTFGTLPTADLVVTLFDLLGVADVQTEGADYTILGEGSEDGGAVVFTVPPPNLYTVLIQRIVPETQPTDIKNQGSFYPRTIERMFDRIIYIIQQLSERVSASLTLPPQVIGVSTELPSPQANTLFGWNADNDAITNFPLSSIATSIVYGDKFYETFTGDGAQVNFGLSSDPASLGNLDVSIDGVVQVPGADFTYIGTVLTFSVAPANGDVILVRYDQAVPVGSALASSTQYTPVATGIPSTVQARLDALQANNAANTGGELVGFRDTLATAYLGTVSDIINGLPVSMHRFLPKAQIAAIIAGTSTYDATDDFNDAYAAFPARGGKLLLPRGDYYLTDEPTIQDRPFTIEGEGSNISRIIQAGVNKSGLIFAVTGSNTVTGDGVQTKCLTVRGLCFMRDGSSGGAAIKGSWVSATSNVPFCIIDDVRVAARNTLSHAFTNGLQLTNVNGLRVSRFSAWGDAAGAATLTAAPFLMQNMILLDGDATAGKINHFLTQVSGGYANTVMKVDGWYEGLYLDQVEVANVGEGYRLVGEAGNRCTNFQTENGHVDFRTSFMVADKWQNISIADSDAYKSGGVGGAGFGATIIALTACPRPRISNTKIENTHSTASSGISANATTTDGSILGGSIKGCGGTAASISGASWRLNDTQYINNGTAVYADANNTNVGSGNSYSGNTTDVAFGLGSGSTRGEGIYRNSVVPTLVGGATSETYDFAIPAGTFATKPSAATLFGSGSNILGWYDFDSASSTATNARFTLRRVDGTNLPAGLVRLSVATFR